MAGISIASGINSALEGYRGEKGRQSAAKLAAEDRMRQQTLENEELRGIRIRNDNAITQENRDELGGILKREGQGIDNLAGALENDETIATQESDIEVQLAENDVKFRRALQDLVNVDPLKDAERHRALAQIVRARKDIATDRFDLEKLDDEQEAYATEAELAASFLVYSAARSNGKLAARYINEDPDYQIDNAADVIFTTNEAGRRVIQAIDAEGNIIVRPDGEPFEYETEMLEQKYFAGLDVDWEKFKSELKQQEAAARGTSDRQNSGVAPAFKPTELDDVRNAVGASLMGEEDVEEIEDLSPEGKAQLNVRSANVEKFRSGGLGLAESVELATLVGSNRDAAIRLQAGIAASGIPGLKQIAANRDMTVAQYIESLIARSASGGAPPTETAR